MISVKAYVKKGNVKGSFDTTFYLYMYRCWSVMGEKFGKSCVAIHAQRELYNEEKEQ